MTLNLRFVEDAGASGNGPLPLGAVSADEPGDAPGIRLANGTARCPEVLRAGHRHVLELLLIGVEADARVARRRARRGGGGSGYRR